MKLKRDYLTSEELFFIINELENTNNIIEAEILKIGTIYQLLVEDAPILDSCNDYYDLYISDNDTSDIDYFYINIKNEYLINDYIENKFSLNKIFKDFFNDIEQKIDEYSNTIDAEKMSLQIEQLKGLIGNDNIQK